MKKSGIDMLHGPIWNKIPLFALPVAATAILGQLFNASDLAVVGNFAGEARTAAVAAVGANSSVVSLVVNLFTGVALGANVVIAGAIGREDTDAAQRAVHTALLDSGLQIPQEAAFRSGGKHGLHSEHLGPLLAEMQYLQRSHPGLQW